VCNSVCKLELVYRMKELKRKNKIRKEQTVCEVWGVKNLSDHQILLNHFCKSKFFNILKRKMDLDNVRVCMCVCVCT
jgi:hypothetical protein